MVKNPPVNAGDIRDTGLIPGSGRFLGVGHGNSLHYSSLENRIEREAWRATVHETAKSDTTEQLSIHACRLAWGLRFCEQGKDGLGTNPLCLSSLRLWFWTCFPELTSACSNGSKAPGWRPSQLPTLVLMNLCRTTQTSSGLTSQ